MNRLRLILLLTFTLALSGPSFAKGHEKRDHDRDDVRHHDRDRDDRRIFHHDRDHDRDDHHIVLSRHASSRPPGWNHGKKEGWGNCNVPPGQAKKVGCHSGTRHHHIVIVRRRHDRDHHVRHTVSSRTGTPSPATAPRPVTTVNPVPGTGGRDDRHAVRMIDAKQ